MYTSSYKEETYFRSFPNVNSKRIKIVFKKLVDWVVQSSIISRTIGKPEKNIRKEREESKV